MLRLLLFLSLLTQYAFGQNMFQVASPDSSLLIEVHVTPQLEWQLFQNGRPLTEKTPISINIKDKGDLGLSAVIKTVKYSQQEEILSPVVQVKNAQISARYKELRLSFSGNWGFEIRLFNEGLAYRFTTNFENKEQVVLGETFGFRPVGCQTVFFPEEDDFYSHNERVYQKLAPNELLASRLASLPLLVQLQGGQNILLTESHLEHYPGLWVRGDQQNGLQGVFPAYPKYTVELTNRDRQPTDRHPYIAKRNGIASFPWRIFMVANRDKDLISNEMPYILAAPAQHSFDWVRPGKVLWDWWTNLNLSGVDFKAGLNQATYQYLIDFAAKNKIEYVLLDEGWSETGHLDQIQSDLNMDSLALYAAQKKVGLILWVTWTTIQKQFDQVLPNLKKWNIAGLKVDFMQRDDQEAIEFYWDIAEKCAQNHLLLDFHGAHKPTGLQRRFPNVLTFEGVFGAEQSKWDLKKRIDPEHNVTIPFIRMAAGPMDYTPGAMLNMQKADWAPSWNRPASLGTRCHELAKYVVFESPLQMLSDSPSNYEKEPECLRFLSQVPSIWEQTIPIAGKIGDFIALARRASNGLWYLGVMSDWTPRRLQLASDWLPTGEYAIEIFQDGLNADRSAQDYRRSTGFIRAGDIIPVQMAPGGGFVAILKPLKKP
jgi:alpha-glucosidase